MTYTLAYNNYRMTIENSIGTWSGEKVKEIYQLQCPQSSTYQKCGQTLTNYYVDQPYGIFGVDGFNRGTRNADSKILGSIAYITRADSFQASRLYLVVSADSVEYANNVAYIEPGYHSSKRTFQLYDIQGGGAQNLIASDLTAIGGAGSYFHNAWQTNNIDIGVTLGDVASIFTSSKGAHVCHRYVDGVLTNEPLWPWPMNQRIIDAMIESGRAPVDVTKTIEQLFGSIPDQCRKTDGQTTVLRPPTNLTLIMQ
jgi:hypothetical protein